LQSVLDRTQFAAINRDFHDLKKKSRRTPSWFSLLGGPSNRRELARQAGRLFEYSVLYGKWSETSHAETAAQFVGLGRLPGEVGFTRIRYPGDPGGMFERTCLASSFLLDATRRMIQHFRPGENLEGWYRREVQDRLFQVCDRRARSPRA
jgi:hypothetical protein